MRVPNREGLGRVPNREGSGRVPNREGSPFFEAAVAAALAFATRTATLGEAVVDRSAKIKSVGDAARMAALRGDTCQIRNDHTRWQSPAILGKPWPSVVIRCNQMQSDAIRGHQWYLGGDDDGSRLRRG